MDCAVSDFVGWILFEVFHDWKKSVRFTFLFAKDKRNLIAGCSDQFLGAGSMLFLIPIQSAQEGFGVPFQGMSPLGAGMPFGMLRNDPYSRYDTTASGNWYKADEPWGAYLQGDGHPAKNFSNPQAGTTWVPIDNSSWPNYNVHGYGIY